MDCCIDQKPVILADGQAIALTSTNSSTTTTSSDESTTEKTIDQKNICKGCQLPVVDKFMLKVCNRVHHENCVRCSVCAILLSDKCFERSGRLYCGLHYYEESSPYRCAGCRQGIAPTEMVYRIKGDIIYHVSCHRCAQCGRKISQGEQICIDEITKSIACINHTVCKSDLFGISMPKTATVCVIGTDDGNIFSDTVPRELDSPTSLFTYSYDAYGYEHNDESKFLKRRGPRTTIKQYQLDVLNRMFTSTPKPSKHARAKLALETGLSMRVIQVWFQNRRSKERRLKHLCNYLRRFEQRGLLPPPLGFDRSISGRAPSADSITLEQLLSFPFEADDEGGEIIN